MSKLTIEQFLNYRKIKDVKNLITEKQFTEINKLFDYYDCQTIKNRLTNLKDFILNNVEDHWLGRLKIITSKLKNDVISEYSCKIRYGNNWKQKQDTLKEKVKMDKNNFIKKYGEKEGIKRWEERNKKTVSYGINPAIMRYGEIEGKRRWEDTLRRKVNTMTERKKIRPYRNGRTLPEYQEKYGIEEGFKLWDERNKRQSYRLSLTGHIDKYGEVEGKKKWEEYTKSMARTTLESFIERHGVEIGTKRYEMFVNRLKYTTSENYFIEKYGETTGKIKYKELITSKISTFKDKYSKISQDLFWGIYEKLDKKENCYFYELNSEYTFYVWNENMKIINVDFKLGNKIIEFDGDYWHSSEEQIKIDNMRDDYLKKKNYIIKRVKEKDFRKNKEVIINECLDFLNNE
jgi:hypothetical protein